jgi:transposase
MPRYKPYDYAQLMMIPVSLEEQLVPGTLEYAIHTVIEERIDTSVFDQQYNNDETGRQAYDPKTLLKVILFAYSRGILHSRPIERACKENVTFMALACGQRPDHSTIAAFVSSMGEKIVIDLFTQVLLVCQDEGLLGGTHFSVDGLKLSSNASKEWSGKHSDLRKKHEALKRKVAESVREHREADKRGGDPDRERREQRIKSLSQKADRIEKFLAENEPKQGKRGKEIQSNVTDNDSAKMTSSHGVIQGYNANAVVDEKNQVVVHAEVFGDASDSTAMESLLDGTKRNLQAIGKEDPLKDKTVSADTGYFSTTNLQACRDAEVDAYVPDPKFRERDVRFAEAKRHRRPTDKHKQRYKKKPSKWFTNEDFHYDNSKGKLVCPAGKELYIKNRNFFTPEGFLGVAYQAPARACNNCTLRAQCLRNPASTMGRQVHYLHGRRPGALTDEMREKIDTPEARKIYGKRLAIVEPVFGNLRACKRMDRFTLRGRSKVNIQWTLYCMLHNIEKIAHFGKTQVAAA